MSDKSPPSSSNPDVSGLGEVFLEFHAVGVSMKVSAIHAASGVEVSAIAPVRTARADLQRLVLAKLEQRLRREGLI